MSYNRTIWENNKTPLNANNLNNIEEGILKLLSLLSETKTTATEANMKANKLSIELKKLAESLGSSTNNFMGTRAEYEAANAAGLIPIGSIVIIQDDESSDTPSVSKTTALLGQAMLGSMVLGES